MHDPLLDPNEDVRNKGTADIGGQHTDQKTAAHAQCSRIAIRLIAEFFRRLQDLLPGCRRSLDPTFLAVENHGGKCHGDTGFRTDVF